MRFYDINSVFLMQKKHFIKVSQNIGFSRLWELKIRFRQNMVIRCQIDVAATPNFVSIYATVLELFWKKTGGGKFCPPLSGARVNPAAAGPPRHRYFTKRKRSNFMPPPPSGSWAKGFRK